MSMFEKNPRFALMIEVVIGVCVLAGAGYMIVSIFIPTDSQVTTVIAKPKVPYKPKDFQQTKTGEDGVAYKFTRTLHADAVIDCIEVKRASDEKAKAQPYLACSVWRNPNGAE